jgi:hypothetical protein
MPEQSDPEGFSLHVGGNVQTKELELSGGIIHQLPVLPSFACRDARPSEDEHTFHSMMASFGRVNFWERPRADRDPTLMGHRESVKNARVANLGMP